MTVTSMEKDLDGLTFTLVAEFDAPIDRVWQLWADPRQLERWWGPPTYPATVRAHDLTPDGAVTYYMTSPEGEEFHGWWRITSVDPPRSLEFIDGFADQQGKPAEGMPTTVLRMRLTEQPDGTRMEMRSEFGSRQQMDQMVEMGMIEGTTGAVGQIDSLLAD
jgi:uncharacterized protein YndB with AHSA1/START domain